jgi:LytR cell envelope-related transcriptional attenuator
VRARLSVLVFALACGSDPGRAHAVPGDRGPALLVEVLNASGQPGDARVGTRLLRRAGIDVVYFGNAPAAVGILDSTRIIVRRGSADVGARVRGALGVGRVEVQLDSGRLLDASVLLGADFAPPPRLDFHP